MNRRHRSRRGFPFRISPRFCVAAFSTATGLLLVPQATAEAATGCVSLGAAANYSEYVAGTASVSSESIAGSAAYGGPASISASLIASATVPISAITLVIGNSSSLSTSNLANGSGEYVGTLTQSANSGGTLTQEASQSALPIQFATTQSALAAASSTIAGLASTDSATGTTALVLTSAGAGTDVFSLTEAQLHAASTIAITAPASAVIVVNVTGTGALSLSHQTVTLSGIGATNVIWNLPSVSSASLSSETLFGTLLQPSGTFAMSTSHLTGSLLSGGATAQLSSNQVNLGQFTGCVSNQPGTGTPEVPMEILIPIAAIGLLGGTGLFASRRRRRRSLVIT
jgi:choice-of-anchor A domain-containing protein